MNEQWYDERWRALSHSQRVRAAEAIRDVLSPQDVEAIRAKHAEHGHDWIHHLIDIDPEETPNLHEAGMVTMSAHHGWGTGIRNLLRSEDGANIPDDELPPAEWTHIVLEDGSHPFEQNWDDYYCQAVEAACGLRDV